MPQPSTWVTVMGAGGTPMPGVHRCFEGFELGLFGDDDNVGHLRAVRNRVVDNFLFLGDHHGDGLLHGSGFLGKIHFVAQGDFTAGSWEA